MVSSVFVPFGVAAAQTTDSPSLTDLDLEDCTVVSEEDSIQDAIDEAAPGETICIEPGTYNEELVITTDDIALVAVGAEETAVSAPYQADKGIHIDGATGVTIQNLTVEYFDEYGVLLENAHETHLKNVSIADNGDEGFAIYDSDDVRLSESEITKHTDWNGESTLTISNASNVELLNNTITGNGHDINVSHADGLLVTGNEISDNTNGDGTRFVVSDSLGVTISDNDFSNQRGGIVLENADDAVVVNNQIANVDEYGIYVQSTNGALVENNTVTGSGAGIDFLLESSTNLTLTENTFDSGVVFDGTDLAHFDHSVTNNAVGDGSLYYVSGAADPAIPEDAAQAIIVDSSDVSITGGSFNDVPVGLQVAFSDGAQITDLETTNTHHIGLYIVGSDGALVENVTATDSASIGIQIAESAGAMLTRNTVSNNGDAGIHLARDDESTVENNTATNNGDGVRVVDSDGTLLTNTDATGNDRHGIFISNGLDVTASTNNGANNGDDGIHVSASNGVSVVENGLSENGHSGVGVSDSVGTVVDKNTVSNNDETGVTVTNAIGGVVTNTVTTGSEYGIHVLGADGTNVSHNDVADNTEGIVVEDSSSVAVDGNVVWENAGVLSEGTGIIVLESADTRVTNNSAMNNDFAAIIVDQSDGTTVENTTASGHEADLILKESTNASVLDNTLETGLFLDGDVLDHFEHEVDENSVGGKELFYTSGADAPTVPDGVGQVFVVDSTNVNVSGHELDGVATGIQVAFSNGAEISNNTVTNSTLTTQQSDSQAYLVTQPGGVTVRGSDNAFLRGNTLTENAYHGIRLADSSDVEIESNTASDNRHGISIVDTERALLETNTVLDHDDSNLGVGIYVRSSSAPELRANELQGNRHGIELFGTFDGFIEGNNATGNSDGIVVHESDQTHIVGNAVTNTDTYGIRVGSDSDEAVIEQNDVNNSGWGGIYLSGTSHDAIIRDNIVTNTDDGSTLGTAGIQVGYQGGSWSEQPRRAMIENNTVTHSTEHNIFVINAQDVSVANNTVSGSGGDGIRVSRTVRINYLLDIVVRENTIDDSGQHGISVTRAPEVLISQNEISGSKDGGVRVSRSEYSGFDEARVLWNEITDTDGYGIIISEQSVTRVEHNYAAGNRADLLLNEAPNSRVLSNEFQRGVLIDGEDSEYYAHNFTATTVNGGHITTVAGDNATIDAEATQLIFVETDGLEVTGDDVSENLTSMQVALADNVSLTDLEVSDGLGVHATRSSNVTVDGVTVSNASYGGVTFDQADSSSIANSTLTANRDHGLILEDSANAVVDRNTISNNAGAGIYGLIHEDADETEITANTVDANRVGIELEGLKDGYGIAYIRDVTAHDNAVTNNDVGIYAHYRVDNVDVRFNDIVDNAEGIVYDLSHPSWPMDARHTWWGETSGPSGDVEDPDTGRLADGTGDSIDQNVLFDPWSELPPGPTFEVGIESTNAPVIAGEVLTVTVTVENLDDEADTQTIELVDFNDTVVDAVEDLTLEGGETESVSLSWQTAADTIGTDEIAVRSASHSVVETVEIEQPPEEAFFDVSIDGTNAPVNAGEDLEVTVTIENTGDEAGTQTIELEGFDGTVVDSQELTLGGGETETVALTWATDEADHGQGEVTVRSADDAATDRVTLLSDQVIEIETCTVLDAAGNYVLTDDLAGGATCLEITADDVVLDGMGYAIQGGSLDDGTQYGIAVTGADRVTVRNVTVSGWDVGLYYNEATNGTVTDVVTEHNGAGFNLRSANDNDVSNLTIRYNDNRGLQVGWAGGPSHGNAFTDVHAYGNEDELSGLSSPGAVSVQSGSTGNSFVGLNSSMNQAGVLTFGSSNTFTDVVANDNTMYGLNLESNQGNAFENVSVARNGWNGIIVDDSNGNQLTNVTAVENDGAGILLIGDTRWNTPVTGNVFHSVTAADNDGSGVQLSVADNSEFHGLELHNNSGSSLNLASRSSENTFTDVVITDSGWHGFVAGSDSHNNTVTDLSVSNSEAAGIAFSWGASGNKIIDATVTESASGFQSFQGATNNPVSNLELDGVTLSFEAQDVQIDVADEPNTLPADVYSLERYVNVSPTGEEPHVDTLFAHYDAADLTGIDDTTLDLWRLNDTWSPPGDESYDSGVNTSEKYVYATNVDEFGTFGVFSEEPNAIPDVIDATLDTDELVEGESTKITATVENAGTVDGDVTVALEVDGDVVATETVWLEAGNTDQVAFTHVFATAGTFDVSVSGTHAGDLTVLEDADIVVYGGSVSHADVAIDDVVTITGDLYNTGDVEGDVTVVMTISGDHVDEEMSQTVTVEPGLERDGVEFSWTPTEDTLPGGVDSDEVTIMLNSLVVDTVSLEHQYSDIQVIAASSTDDEVVGGKAFSVTGSIYQNGTIEGPEAITLTATPTDGGDSIELGSQAVTLQPGWYHLGGLNITASFEPDDAGSYDLKLGDRNAGTIEVEPAKSDIQVIAAAPSEIELVEGEVLYVTGSIYQNGTIEGPEEVELTATNTETGETTVVGSQEVTLNPGWYHLGMLNVTYVPDEAGTFDLELGDHHAGTIEVLPAESDIQVIAAGVSEVELVEGEDLYVTGSIYQNGTIEGPQEIEVTAIDQETGESTVLGTQVETLNPGWYHLGGLNVTVVPDPGTYDIELGDHHAGTIEVLPAESDVQVIAAGVSKVELVEGEDLYVTGSIYQNGTIEGPEEIEVTAINQETGETTIVGSQEVTLQPGWYHLGGLNVTVVPDPGTYELQLGDRNAGTIEVEPGESDIQVIGAGVSEVEVNVGEELSVTGSIYQAGNIDGPQEIELTATNTETGETTVVESQEVTLQPGFYHLGALNVTYVPDEAGTYDLELGDREVATIAVNEIATDIQVIASSLSEAEVIEGEPVHVTGSVYQNGSDEATETIELIAIDQETGEGAVVDSQEVTLQPGYYHLGALNLTYVPDEAGTYDLVLGDRDVGTVEVGPAVSDVQVIAASASEIELVEGEDLYVTGSVYQNGTIEGPEEIELTATNTETGEKIVVGSQEVTLKPGWYHLGGFNVTYIPDEPGEYDLELGDRHAGTIEVLPAESDIQVIAAGVSEVELVEGEDLYVTGSVYQNGTIEGPEEIELTATNTETGETAVVGSQEVTLQPGWYHLGGLNVTYVPEEPGTYDLELGDRHAGTIEVLPAESDIQVIAATASALEIAEGQEFSVTGGIYQNGTIEGPETITLTAIPADGGEPIELGSQEVTLQPGWYHLGGLNVSATLEQPGTYDLELGDQSTGQLVVTQATVEPTIVAVEGHSSANDFISADDALETDGPVVYASDDATVEVAVDADHPVEEVTVLISSLETTYSVSTEASRQGDTWVASIPFERLPDDGRYELSAFAADDRDNGGMDQAEKTLVIDRQSPSLAVSIEDVDHEDATIVIESDEPLAELPTVDVSFDGTTGQTTAATAPTVTDLEADPSNTTFTGTLTFDDSGEYAVDVTGVDRAGNEGDDSASAVVHTGFVLDDGVIEIEATGTTIAFELADDADEALQTQELFLALSETAVNANLDDDAIGVTFLTADLDDFLDYHLETGTIEGATITTPIDESTLPAGTDVTDVGLHYYDEGSQTWDPVASSIVSVDDEPHLTATVDGFSTYGVLIVDEDAPTLTSVTPADGGELAAGTDETTVHFTYEDALSGVDVNSISLEVDGVTVTTDDRTQITSTETTLDLELEDGDSHTVVLTVADEGGNAAPFETTFEVATPADDSDDDGSSDGSDDSSDDDSSDDDSSDDDSSDDSSDDDESDSDDSDDGDNCTCDEELPEDESDDGDSSGDDSDEDASNEDESNENDSGEDDSTDDSTPDDSTSDDTGSDDAESDTSDGDGDDRSVGEDEPSDDTDDDSIPGFGVGLTLVALLFVGLLGRRVDTNRR
ncbi:right-handed parallel beta-helix repeat-containing protein [Natronosalvus halobius]|uniref:right-handed parallel beta-helix repeat-containing protein n=1 Tax=Natronosalvus halobius TaxID=2953746 RepID=UPI0020A017DC|nr:right-handed parallel beta-helix repeat-containing protein [Natronosalvus halobius]USZ71487.1 right-handed parallel beta-helix repeat-containing protein [Natronosalvus halobius]